MLFPTNVAKDRFIEKLRSELCSIKQAAEYAGINPRQYYRWRKKDPEFCAAVEAAKESQADLRVEALEDSIFRRMMAGGESAALQIFWLKVHGGEKYRRADTHRLLHSGVVDVLDRRREADRELREYEAEMGVLADTGARLVPDGGSAEDNPAALPSCAADDIEYNGRDDDGFQAPLEEQDDG